MTLMVMYYIPLELLLEQQMKIVLFEKNRLNIMTLCKKIAQSNLDLKYNYLEVYENNTNRIS